MLQTLDAIEYLSAKSVFKKKKKKQLSVRKIEIAYILNIISNNGSLARIIK
jgi:hypothetical protein